jgi:alpha/beta superfamily hydrolase
MSEVFHRSFFLDGRAGRLEGLLWTSPQPAPQLAALVCHPHPLFGGTMHNKVVFHVARTMHRLGLPVLRFNFRGVELSEGAHDRGRGELDDVRAAIDWLAREFPGCPLALAGFSFGAWVGLRVGCEDERVAELVGLGLPVNDSDLSYLRGCTKPKLFIQGERDQFGARDRLEELFAALPEPKQLEFVPDADHFFTGKLAAVDRALRAWLVARHLALSDQHRGLVIQDQLSSP